MDFYTKLNFGQNIGLPTFDRTEEKRIWAFKKNETSSLWEVCYSDDYGEVWNYWATPLPQPTGQRGPYIHRDSNGNIYFQSGTERWRTFHQINYSTKQVAKVIDFYYPNGGVVDIYPWNFTEDNDGYIFVSQYYLSANGGHMMFRSAPEHKGKMFESLDILIKDFPDARHFHGTYANPYNGKLYIQIGDFAAKKFLVSSDKLESYKVIGGISGHTGLTFTSEAVYTSEDLPNSNNRVWRTIDDIDYEICWTPPPSLIKTPIYYCHAVGDNELWLTFVDDNKSSQLNSAVVCLRKKPGVNEVWTQSLIDQYEGSEFDNSNWYALSSNGQGIIPESSPYVFVEKCWWDIANDKPTTQGVYRIKRTPSELANGYFVVNIDGTIKEASLVSNVSGVVTKQQSVVLPH